MGIVENLVKTGENSLQIKIKAEKIISNIKIGDSIATNGICLTVTSFGNNYFTADTMPETVKRTSLHNIKKGDYVNLEKSITLQTPLGGHIVTGDVDCTGVISEIYKDGIAIIYKIKLNEPRYAKYIVEKGRITLDGASLTIVDYNNDYFTISIIPHTQKEIILGKKKIGDLVNIETDLIGKYIERFLEFKGEKKSEINMGFLAENGFI